MYTATTLLPVDRDFWAGDTTYQRQKELGCHTTEEIEDIQDRALLATIMDTMGQTQPEGISKIHNIIMQCLHNHVEEIRKIAEEYSIKTEVSSNENK
ncbi:MAG: hypothetical protein WAM14_22115 [Candidatus Nitrosopolaris sp.]